MFLYLSHCVKSVQTQSYFWSLFGQFSRSVIYQLYDLILRLYILFLQDSCVHPIKKGLVIETSFDLIYILHIILTQFLLFTTFIWPKPFSYLLLFDIPTNFMINNEKDFSMVICACCMSCSEIFLSQDGAFQHSRVAAKKTWWPLVNAYLMSQYQENVIRFNFLANALKHCYHYLGNLSQTRSSSVLEDPYFFLQNSQAKMNLDDQRKILNPRSANHSEKHSNLLYFTLSSQYLLIVNKFLLETISYNG